MWTVACLVLPYYGVPGGAVSDGHQLATKRFERWLRSGSSESELQIHSTIAFKAEELERSFWIFYFLILQLHFVEEPLECEN